MRKGKLFVSGMLAAALTFGVILAGCDNGTSPDGGGTTTIILSGTLSGGGSSTDAATQTFRAEVGSNNSISGKLKDGSITFELAGAYDPATKVFSMQAPASLMIFSIAGKLNAGNTIDPDSISASVKLKGSNDEWTTVALVLTSSDQAVDGEADANTVDVTSVPAYCRGTWREQIAAEIGGNVKFVMTQNSITKYDGFSVDEITVVEVTNADGSAADENGPWACIAQIKYYNAYFTAKFYVSRTWDTRLDSEIGNQTVADVTRDGGGIMNNTTLSNAENGFSGVRMYITPYASNDSSKVSTANVYPDNGWSPLFTGSQATANARVATVLKAFSSGLTLILK